MKPSRTIITGLLLLSSISFAQSGGDKLDVKALEQKYWAAKDDDFSVVQNRAFSKAKKYFGTLHYGRAINDPYYSGDYMGLSAGYYFSESWGLEATYQKMSMNRSNSFNEILRLGGGPTVNKPSAKIGINALWMPIYAKMSLFDKKIIHFDMGFSFGVTQTGYDKMYYDGNFTTFNDAQLKSKGDTAVGYSIGVTQQFYFSQKAAIRVDFMNTFSSQNTVNFKNTSGGTPASGSKKSINDTSLMIGISIFDWRQK